MVHTKACTALVDFVRLILATIMACGCSTGPKVKVGAQNHAASVRHVGAVDHVVLPHMVLGVLPHAAM